ncbi:hypothetical protein [Microbacterium sp. ZW T5_56]|uniref:hypothetical protein n=1 Tax=Microbacterium sp. ZW T5_56 TaxID=3378081 RepID=UPI003851F42D
MNQMSAEERRRLLAAAYGREGAGLEPAEAQRLTELMQPQLDGPPAGRHDAEVVNDASVPQPLPSLARRPRRAFALLATAAALVAAFTAGWAVNAWVPASTSAAGMVAVGDSIAATRVVARAALANQTDPGTLVYIGTLFDAAVWEARSTDRATRCFIAAPLTETNGTHLSEVLACAPETENGARLSSYPVTADEYSAKEVVDAWWTDAQPARLMSTWVDVKTTTAPLEPNAVVERTAQIVFKLGGPHATPVAVFGLTSLWAVERQDLHCVYAVTLIGPAADASTYRESSSCRDELVYGEQQTWTYPSDEFDPSSAPSGKYFRTVVTWLPGQDPVATLRKQ